MEKITITCTRNNRTKDADVILKTDKHLKVALEGTQITIEMHRDDLNKPYTGHTAGLEFVWQPKN